MRKSTVFVWAVIVLLIPISAIVQIQEERGTVVDQEIYAQLESSSDAAVYAATLNCFKEGDPAFYVDFGLESLDVTKGEPVWLTLGPTNFGFTNPPGHCDSADTFCVHYYENRGWISSTVPPMDSCIIVDPGYLWWQDVCITVPCDVDVGTRDTLIATMAYCAAGMCAPECGDCEDPNSYGGDPYYSADTIVLNAVEPPLGLAIVQDSVCYIEHGQDTVYVPFTICNIYQCADPTVYDYAINCTPLVGSLCTGFPQAGSTDPIPGGECEDVHGVVDVGSASSGDKCALQIVAWDAATSTVYDTCVQIVHIFGKLIPQVPDASQPPTNTLGRPHVSNYCAPMSAVNITEYWDVVIGHPNAVGVNAGLGPATAAEYIGYFMDTNDFGNPTRANGTLYTSANGTYAIDEKPGFFEFVRWDNANLFTTPSSAIPLPPGKNGYTWTFTYLDINMASSSAGFEFCATSIDLGLPIKIDFFYWNPQPTGISTVDPASGETIDFFYWGDPVDFSVDPDEEWNNEEGEEGIGHAVTGVGYFRNYDPSGTGSLPRKNYIIVHDNWTPKTPRNVAIPWANWNAAISVEPNSGPAISQTVDLTPYFDWGAISSSPGLAPPGTMGISSPAHPANFYFPSDCVVRPPAAWLTPGNHLATRYGPANTGITASPCPMGKAIVHVYDQNSKPCYLFVEVPPVNLIDQATDLNVIQISPGETKTIPLNRGCVDILVFLASCGGLVTAPGVPSLSQPLEVWLNYRCGCIDTVVINNIHPAGRQAIVDDPAFPPSWIFIFGNEVFVCNPMYFDTPSPSHDALYSEAWHWYALFPKTDKYINSLTFVGIQTGEIEEIYISAISYRHFTGVQTGVDLPEEGPIFPGSFQLSQSFPNPFNPITTIRYSIPVEGPVSLKIYDILGRRIRTLVDRHQASGVHTVQWDGRNDSGVRVASGVYFYRLQAGSYAETRKMVLLR